MRTQLILVGLSLLLLPSSSLADSNAAEAPDMQMLYDDAIRLMSAGDYAKACPMIERVTQMAPDGLGAQVTLAECYEEQGKLANAYTIFVHVKKAGQEKGQTERSQKAAARADALRPQLAQITFTGSQSLASGYALRVEIDGVSIESSQLAEPRYVDAGTHHIVAFAKDERCNEMAIDIAAGAVQDMPIRELLNLSGHERSPDSSTPSDSWGSSPSTVPTWEAERSPSKQAAKRGFPVWSAVVGGFGLVAIGVGAAFKLDSAAAEQKLFDNCGKDLL
ncbi:MAG TPA: tetratricopeptide repeat protein, partial [Polyangium sp.]|nr:tetratricopeptide repeat protein [Polyangium sp.]